MDIRIGTAANQNSFRGLLGRKMAHGCEMFAEQRMVDRYYPFPGETPKQTEAAIAYIKSIVFDHYKRGPYAQGEITIQPVLPFTKEEYVAYKSKDNAVLEKGLLTEKDRLIERFFRLESCNGLCSYLNEYREPLNFWGRYKKFVSFFMGIFEKSKL